MKGNVSKNRAGKDGAPGPKGDKGDRGDGIATSTNGENNELFNDVSSHTVTDESAKNNHLEGAGNTVKKAHSAYVIESNHLEGSGNIAGGYAGHAENSSNEVYETNAHAGGKYSVASGSGSMAQGRGVIAFGCASNATGQSAFNGNINDTTVLGTDGTETAIDWDCKADEDEAGRAKRIADRLAALWHGTAKKTDGTENKSVFRQFLAAIGHGAKAGGVNSFANGKGALAHGTGCFAGAENAVATGSYSDATAPESFAHGKTAKAKGESSAAIGSNVTSNGINSFVTGSYTESTQKAENSFTGGEASQSQAKNAFTFGKGCYAASENSAAFGEGTVVGTKNQFAVGKYNNNESNALFAVGGGSASARKNVFEVAGDGNIKVATGATISNPESHKGNGSIKFGEFGIEITDALGDALYFSTVGIELSCKNSGSQDRTSYRLINYDKQLPAWSNKDLFEDLKFLYEKIKNALTTDKANVANGYVALDSNGNIKIASGQKLCYSQYPEAGGIKFIDTAMRLTSPAECGLSIDTVGVDIDFGNSKTYRLGSLGDQAPSDSTGDLMADLKAIFEKQSSIASQVAAMFSAMATKPTVLTATTPQNVYSVNDNTEYLLIGSGAIIGTLTLEFGGVSPFTDSYASYISFETGDTPPTVAINGSHVTVVFRGDDCDSEGNFIPAANKKYEVALKRVGTVDNKPYVVARVGAC